MQTESSSQQSRFQRLSLSRRQLLNRLFDLLNAHGCRIYCDGRLQQLPNLRYPRDMRLDFLRATSCRCESFLGEFQDSQRLFLFHPRKPLEELINCRTGFEILEQRFDWNTRVFESPRAAQRICQKFYCRARAPIDHLSILSPVFHTAKRLWLFENPQLKRSVLLTINFSEKDFPAAIGGSGETLPE
jgi:hypothetical protein